ncbi:hypothetical protein BHAOGJBA_1670 [Methylobacterium hispanicum]|uniref:Peptidoglycan-binding protein n=1 Tax=Methylobacterium hispanicum TaxID=270350 RepID=A0AAV4ZJ20_9HYPH|nr:MULTISPECIES: peptidoglycan-binding protein [Methylobacterium]GJD88157.1 hypothetical protein BHAOGJBA_1670 [Methylobacterium hispanicum]
MTLPWWATAVLTLIAKIFNQWLANKRAEVAMRDLGAATARVDGLRKAERQEQKARAAGAAAAEAQDDPRDLRD